MNEEGNERQERRKHGQLSPEQIEAIKDAILASVYEDIGRSLVTKALWVVGAVFAALLAYFHAKGYIK